MEHQVLRRSPRSNDLLSLEKNSADSPCKFDVNENTQWKMSWSYPSRIALVIAVGCTLLTILFNYLLTIAYPDTMPGPTLILSLISYTPVLTAYMVYRESFSQIYGMSFLVLMPIWVLIPLGVGVSVWSGLPLGIGFWLLTSASLHLWSASLRDKPVDIFWIIRFLSMFMITVYVQSELYGSLISPGIQFHTAPFILQPISIFGFGTFEALVIITNLAIAWLIREWVSAGKWIPSLKRPSVKNPFLIVSAIWLLWVITSGIVAVSHSPIGKVKVATLGGSSVTSNKDPHSPERAAAVGRAIRNRIKLTGAKFLVAPETFIHASPFTKSCEEMIHDDIAPLVKGLGAFVTIGCGSHMPFKYPSCSYANLAYTISPDGDIIIRYGKLRPTPMEKSCFKPGITVKETLTDNNVSVKFGSVICYDADFSGPISQTADKGAALILNPASDWEEVRHHFAVTVIRAIENRVAIVKAEDNIDPVIVDPFGRIVAIGGEDHGTDISGEVSISSPLSIAWIRQQLAYWIWIAVYAAFLCFDVYTLIKRRKSTH